MPINENDIPLFSIVEPIDLSIEMLNVVEKMTDEAKERMERDKLDTTNCYPEMHVNEQENSFRLVIYKRVQGGLGT